MYYVLKYYKYVLIGVSVLLLAAGSLAILGRFQRGGVKGLALEYRTFRGKWSMVPLILAVLLLNLFRDQLDRCGEIDRIQTSIAGALTASPDTVLVYNADDPLCARIADAL